MNFRIQDNQCVFEIELQIYEVDVICKTAYQFIDEYYVFFEVIEDNQVRVYLESKETVEKEVLIGLGKEFSNELLNQKVRYSVSKSTKNVRELILGRALYSVCVEVQDNQVLQEDENRDESREQLEDLDDIAVNWFEYYQEEHVNE